MKDTHKELTDKIERLEGELAALKATEATHRETEEKLRQSEEHLCMLMNFTYDWEYWLNPEGKIAYMSPSCERISGHSPEEFLHDPGLLATIVHPEDRQDFIKHLEDEKHKRAVFTLSFRILSRSGEERWIEHSCQPVYGVGGRYLGQRASNRDATERKQVEEELKASEEKYRSLVSNIPAVAWTSDEDYNMIFVAPNVERLTGYTQEEEYRCGNWIKWFDHRVHPEDIKKAKADFRRFSSQGKPYDIEYRYKRKDGRWVWLNERSVGTYEKNGKRYADGIIADVTARKQAEEELKASEEKYRSLVSNIPDVAWTSDENCNILYISPNVERITGYTQDEEYHAGNWLKWFDTRVHPEDSENTKTAFKEFVKGGKPYDIEYRYKRKDGRWVWINERSVGTYEKNGKRYADGLIADITARKHAEEELKANEEKYRSLVSNIPDVAWTSDENYNMVFVAPNVKRLTGYTQEEEYRYVNWMTWFGRLHPDDAEKTKTAFKEFVKGGKPYDIEYRFRTKAGHWIWINERSVGTYEKNGKRYADGLIADVTARKHAEEELKASEEKYRSLVSNIPDVAWTSDENCNILYISPNVERLTGYTQDEEYHTGNWMEWMNRIVLEDREKAKAALWGFIKGKQPYDIEYRFKRKDDKLIWVHDRSLGTYRKNGELYADGLLSDITEKKRLEEARIERAAALAQARAIQQSRQRIIATQEKLRKQIALELHGTVQNRLIVLIHRLAELERNLISRKTCEESADLRQKLIDLVENHIRPVSHQLFPSILRRGIVPALESLVDEFGTTPYIEIDLSKQLNEQEKDNPRFIPEQVRLAIYRIAQEALVNAVKHADAGKITLTLEYIPKGQLHLSIKDNGRGFYAKDTSHGSGIFMMQDYAETVSGECVVKSHPGRGTEVVANVSFTPSAARETKGNIGSTAKGSSQA